MNLEALGQQFPLTPQFDALLRYDASLQQNFDRTLSQLERVQRTRLGQPVLPELEAHPWPWQCLLRPHGDRKPYSTSAGSSPRRGPFLPAIDGGVRGLR